MRTGCWTGSTSALIPVGATVSDNGCPLDADKDGDTTAWIAAWRPRGTSRFLGCPSDSDNDGVFDGIDKCPTHLPERSECDGMPSGSGHRQGRRARRAGQVPQYAASHRGRSGWLSGRGWASAEAASGRKSRWTVPGAMFPMRAQHSRPRPSRCSIRWSQDAGGHYPQGNRLRYAQDRLVPGDNTGSRSSGPTRSAPTSWVREYRLGGSRRWAAVRNRSL
jgi:hypothetical protein